MFLNSDLVLQIWQLSRQFDGQRNSQLGSDHCSLSLWEPDSQVQQEAYDKSSAELGYELELELTHRIYQTA